MNVKEVVKIAIEHINDVFSDEELSNVGLEEVTFNDQGDFWSVTVGFSRPWDYQKPSVVAGLQPRQAVRQFKVVEVRDRDGEVLAVKIRE